MSAPKSTYRGQRRGGASPRLSAELVDDLEKCFRGETESAWCVLLSPPGPDYSAEIRDRWVEWRREHKLPAEQPLPPGLARWLDERTA